MEVQVTAAPWAGPAEASAVALGSDLHEGLTPAEARHRLDRDGPNELRRIDRRGAWAILYDQVRSFIVWLLALGAALSFLANQPLEGLAIVLVLVLNTGFGFVTELRATRSMEALWRLGRVEATVRRGGELVRVPAQAIVPGDLLVVEAGDMITADARVVSGSRIAVDESPLTGESAPVSKSDEPVPAQARLADRRSMLFKGTAVTRGSGTALVVSTGMNTELGRITALAQDVERGETPLEQRLGYLGRRLAWISLGFVALTGVAGVVAGRPPLFMLEMSIALAVAAVPEGLPVVATIALARGMWRMVQHHAVMTRLSAVETLGATTVILTDKTGTLTENRMTVVRALLADGDLDAEQFGSGDAPTLQRLLEVGALCSEAGISADGVAVGDPLEVALLRAAERRGIDRRVLLRAEPELRSEAFDPALRMMATVHALTDGGVRVAVKGAPEAVLALCTRVAGPGGVHPLDAADREGWAGRCEAAARDGLRLLALAERRDASPGGEPYRELVLLGVVAMLDPPRAAVREAIESCRGAGIRVVMVTGDHAATALHVARQVGLVERDAPAEACVVASHDAFVSRPEQTRAASVLARTDPAEKMRLLDLHRDAGEVVAMLGDGVNDAPALRKADIGVAMGQRGTQVAREAAAMVLQDDELGTVVAAVEQGRTIFNNIRKFVVYLVGCNLSEIFTIGLATLLAAPLPIQPLQVLFLNLVTDVFPALALSAGDSEPGVMRRPPRDPREPIVSRREWQTIIVHSLMLTAPVLAGLYVAGTHLGASPERAVTICFLILATGQVLHVFNMASPGGSPLRNEVTTNPWVWAAVLVCGLLLAAAVYLPLLSRVLSLTRPSAGEWAVAVGLGAVPMALGFGWRVVRWGVGSRRPADGSTPPPGGLRAAGR